MPHAFGQLQRGPASSALPCRPGTAAAAGIVVPIIKAPSAKAKCRICRQPIERGAWRIRLVFYDEGRFSPGGFVHLACRKVYFETDDIAERLLRFSPALTDAEREELRVACAAPAAQPSAPAAPSDLGTD